MNKYITVLHMLAVVMCTTAAGLNLYKQSYAMAVAMLMLAVFNGSFLYKSYSEHDTR